MTLEPHPSLLWLEESIVWNLLDQYDYPHPEKPDEVIAGYDKNHALRTAKMCAAVAQYLGHDDDRVKYYQVACLLHDLGRAGLDQNLFGKIWTWAKTRNIPTRPAEWRAEHPETIYGKETEAFWEKYLNDIEKLGITTNSWAREQVEMRLGYERRLKRMVETVKPVLEKLDLNWLEWMEKVTLYYYYPEKLSEEPDWVRELGEILVACEQLEAYSNRERGSDYYNREHESFIDAFNYLDSLQKKEQLGKKVLSAIRHLTAKGKFDVILEEARGKKLSDKERFFLRSLDAGENA